MLEAQILEHRWKRGLTIAFLGAAAFLSSCASQPKQTALVSDPDARSDSAIPWNKPERWEGRENIPGGIGGENAFSDQSGR